MKTNILEKTGFKIIVALVSTVVLLPALGMMLMSFKVFSDFSVLNSLRDSVLISYTINTFLLCLGTVMISLLVSVPSAWVLTFYIVPFKKFFDWLSILPMIMPAYVLAYAYTDALDYSGWLSIYIRDFFFKFGFIEDPLLNRTFWPEIRSLTGACFILGIALSPYITLLARTSFEMRQLNLIDAAKTMGISGIRLFFSTTLPLARPAIVAGSSLVVMECLADYGTVSFFSIQTLSSGLYKAWFGYGDLNTASLIGLLMLFIAFFAISVEKFFRGSAKYGNFNHIEKKNKLPLNTKRKILAISICSISGFFGFIIPVFLLLKSSFDEVNLGYFTIESFVSISYSLLNSVFFGLVSVFIIISSSIIIAYAIRHEVSNKLKYLIELLLSGYAVAGLVSALSLLSLSGLITIFLSSLFDISFSLSTTITLLLIAYVSRFFAVGFTPINIGLSGIKTSIDNSARTFGLSGLNIFFRLHLPLLKTSSILASMLVFIDVIKELPATLVLRPLGTETLAITAYNFASDERLGAAAIPCILIAVVGVIPLIIIKNKWSEIRKF